MFKWECFELESKKEFIDVLYFDSTSISSQIDRHKAIHNWIIEIEESWNEMIMNSKLTTKI